MMSVSAGPRPAPHRRIWCGYIMDAPEWGKLRHWERGALVEEAGRIVKVGAEADVIALFPENHENHWLRAPGGERWLVIPGLVDVHAHLPQYPVVGRVEEALLPWLRRHIFPAEKAFTAARPGIRSEMQAFFADLAAQGTTTALLYGAVWQDSTDLAFSVAEASGLRIAMGKVMMDVGSYGFGADWPSGVTREVSLKESEELIRTWHGRDHGRLEYVVSPRFAVSCSREMMAGAAALAESTCCAVQTHLSENHAEIALVASLFPEAANYTDIYYKAGLLGSRTVLGHCLHLTPQEMEVLAETNSAVAHCPTSNLFLNSGLCPLDRLRRHGLRIGLGSDVAGGPELNLWQVMRSAIESQKARKFHDEQVPELTPAEVFHMATAGGAAVAGHAQRTGTLTVGHDADVAVFDLNSVLPLKGQFANPDPDPHAMAALMVYRGGPHALRGAWVRGRQVAG